MRASILTLATVSLSLAGSGCDTHIPDTPFDGRPYKDLALGEHP